MINISTKVGLLAALIIISTSYKPSYGMGAIPYEATEWTQLANNAQLINLAIKEAQQIAIQFQNLESVYQNSLSFDTYLWEDTFNQLVRLSDIVRSGQALSYSNTNIDLDFKRRFKDHSYYANPNYNSIDYDTQYKLWSDTNYDTIKGTLESVHLHNEMFIDEEKTITQLDQMSQTSQGRMQAVQAGNQIAVQQVRQMQKLRQVTMSNIQMHAAVLASDNEKEKVHHESNKKFLGGNNDIIIGDEEGF